MLSSDDVQGYPGAAIIVSDPYLAYARASHLFETRPAFSSGVHPTAVVAPDAEVHPSASIGAYVVIEAGACIEADVEIGAQSFIGARSRVGEGGRLAPRVTLYHDVQIGKRVVIQSGAVIGGEDSVLPRKRCRQKIAQIGGVRVGDDVEIGSNTTIDRGALSDTLIGNGVKLDNQIMIAHNVQIGDNTAMAGCVGISGSTKIGRNCMIAGGVGMVGHIEGLRQRFRDWNDDGHAFHYRARKLFFRYGHAECGRLEKSAARIRQLDDMARRLQQLEKSGRRDSGSESVF